MADFIRLCIGVTNGGTIRTETVASLLTTVNLPFPLYYSTPISGYAVENRTNIVKAARDWDATHIMFIDNDMIFHKDAITTLLDDNKDIVGAHYNLRNYLPRASATMWVKDGLFTSMPVDQMPNEPFECETVGTGFALVKMSVFDTVSFPWFDTVWVDGDQLLTEDVVFFKRAKQKGLQVWCDPRPVIQHVGNYLY